MLDSRPRLWWKATELEEHWHGFDSPTAAALATPSAAAAPAAANNNAAAQSSSFCFCCSIIKHCKSTVSSRLTILCSLPIGQPPSIPPQPLDQDLLPNSTQADMQHILPEASFQWFRALQQNSTAYLENFPSTAIPDMWDTSDFQVAYIAVHPHEIKAMQLSLQMLILNTWHCDGRSQLPLVNLLSLIRPRQHLLGHLHVLCNFPHPPPCCAYCTQF